MISNVFGVGKSSTKVASEVRDFSVGKLALKLFGQICFGFVMLRVILQGEAFKVEVEAVMKMVTESLSSCTQFRVKSRGGLGWVARSEVRIHSKSLLVVSLRCFFSWAPSLISKPLT